MMDHEDIKHSFALGCWWTGFSYTILQFTVVSEEFTYCPLNVSLVILTTGHKHPLILTNNVRNFAEIKF